MSYVQLGVQNSQNNNNNNFTSGGPGSNGDGVNWPYNNDPINGQTPNFQINWNSSPPPTAKQVEATYEALVNWLQNNTGSPAFYNGAMLFLQMTVDIGQHLGSFSQSDQTQLKNFLANQISTGGDQIFLQKIIQVAAEASAISGTDGQDGLNKAEQFLNQLKNAVAGLANIPPFDSIFNEANNELDQDPRNSDSIYNWIFGSSQAGINAHWIQTANSANGQGYWADDEGAGGWDPTINGQQPILSFTQFTQDATYGLGSLLNTDNNSSVNSTINAYYTTQIDALVAQFKGNPWALLAALMNLINERDQDNGMSVNGYGGTLDLLKQANGIIQKMLGDISGSTPNMADFYTQLSQLKQLVLQDPALSTVASQLENDINTVNGQTYTHDSDWNWQISSAGYYNFPPGTTYYFNNVKYTAPANGVVYIPSAGPCMIPGQSGVNVTFTFGQLAAMGDTSDIAKQMEAWTNNQGGSGTGTNWSSTIMSNFENSVTGIQTLMNSPSASLQQQIQNTTQTMQAEENFEKEAYDSITNVNQNVMKLIQSITS